jgi:hypothetical protein
MMGLGKSPEAALANTGFTDFVSQAYIVTTKLLARGLSSEVDEVRAEVNVQTPLHAIAGAFPISTDQVAGVRL